MSVVCLHCKVRGAGRPLKGTAGGESRVVETRKVKSRTKIRGKREVTRTVQRVRECKKCRWRWKTIEVTVIPARKKDR